VGQTGLAGLRRSQFAKLEIAQVPRDWLASLPHLQPQDVPFTTLQAWAQTAFAHVFTNVVNAAELAAAAQRTTAELFRHLDGLVAQARALPDKATLLGCLMSPIPPTTVWRPIATPSFVRLLLAELIVGSSGTLAQALPILSIICYSIPTSSIRSSATPTTNSTR